MARPWLFVAAIFGLLSAVAGTLYWVRVVRPRESPAFAIAPAPDAGAPAAPAAIASVAPPHQDAVQAALEGNALLTPEAARALVDAWQRRGLATDALRETALLMAIKGFGVLPAARADALRTSFDRLYAALPRDDRAATERLLGQIRDGKAQSEDLARAVTLMDSGVQKLDTVSRRQFQHQYSAAVLVAIAMRDESDRIAAAGPPAYVASKLTAPPGQAAASVPGAEPAVLPGTSYPGGTSGPSGQGAAVPTPGGNRGSAGGDDRGEAYWRNRANQLRAAVERAEATVRAAETELRGTMLRDYQPGCPPLPPVLTSEAIRNYKCSQSSFVPAARAKLEAAQAGLERAKRELEGLDDEARRAGALPGWIR